MTLVNAALGPGQSSVLLQRHAPEQSTQLCQCFLCIFSPCIFFSVLIQSPVCVKTTVIVAELFMPSQCSSNEKQNIFYRLCDLNSFAEGFFENKFLIWPEECFGKVAIDASTFYCIL